MRGRARSIRTAAVAAIAAGGMFAGHLLDYMAVFPGRDRRAHVLAATGHGYLSRALLLAGFAAAFGFATVAILGFLGGRSRAANARPTRLTLRLALLQSCGFAGLEVIERLASGSGLHDLAGRLLGVGVVLQIFVAFAGSLLLRAVYRLAVAAGVRARVRVPRTRRLQFVPQREHPFVPRLLAGRAPARGPPLLSSR